MHKRFQPLGTEMSRERSRSSSPLLHHDNHDNHDCSSAMLSPQNSVVVFDQSTPSSPDALSFEKGNIKDLLNRKRYTGAVLINFVSFLLPALYATLSKYWVSGIDSSSVVTLDSYTYIGVVAEVINEGLPRVAWLIIGDNASRSWSSRVGLSQTMITFQCSLGLLVSFIILGAADKFAAVFVPSDVRAISLTYVQLSAFSTFSGALEYATSNATRALDRPDVPLVINSVRFLINIVLDLLIISPFHVGSWAPSVNIQAGIRLTCDMSAAFAGLLYFLSIVHSTKRKHDIVVDRPTIQAFLTLLRPGILTFLESAIRNTLYLWLVANIIALGSDYATAWGVFNTIRWGLVMVPVNTLEASALAFGGHRWGTFRQSIAQSGVRIRATWSQLKFLLAPAAASAVLALIVEVPLCILLSLLGIRPYARWISGSDAVADITAHMWQTIDWCYIFYALSTQLATVLLATMPSWYLYQSLASNILYVLPWAIVCQVKALNANDAWFYYAFVFGGSLVVSFWIVVAFLALWSWQLWKGNLRVRPVKSAT